MAESFGLAINIATAVDLLAKIGVQCSAYCQNVRAAPREVRDILREADRSHATLKELEKAVSASGSFRIQASQSLIQSLVDFKEQVEDLSAKLESGLQKKGWSLTWPFRKGQVEDKVQRLTRCRQSIALDLQVHQTMLSAKSGQEKLIEKMRIAERATFDTQVDDLYSRCLPGTRADILQHILDWSTADREDIFWLSGMAGTGKSTISRTIAERFQEKQILGASFFFRRGEGDRSRATLLFPTVASQLIRQHPELGGHICHEIEDDANIHDKSLNIQFEKLFSNPLSKLRQPVTSRKPPVVVVVVDALDEADNPEHARLLVRFISQPRHFDGLRLKFFVTSRPELPFQCGFKDLNGRYENLVLHEIPRPVVEHDIAIFFNHELNRIRDDFNRYARRERQLAADWPGTERTTLLVQMAVPLFIYATTVCLFLQERRLGSPEDQLEHIIQKQGTASDKMDATYLPVLDRFFAGLSASETAEISTRFQLVIGSIVLLASPLSATSLSRLLDMPLDKTEDLLEHFSSVLSVPHNSEDPIRLLHKSFHDFLVDPELSKGPQQYPFHVDQLQTHRCLADQCLRLLSTEDVLKQDICDLKEPDTARSDVPQGVIDMRLPPEVQYACRFWALHWIAGRCSANTGDALDRFLKRCLLYWIEAQVLLGRISETIHMVNDLLEYVDSDDSDSIGALLRDVLRIILGHRSILEDCPLQLYCSALVLAPENSLVRQMFSNLLPRWLSILSPNDVNWDACRSTFEHAGVRCIALSPDGRMLASGGQDSIVNLWDTATNVCLATLVGHTDCVGSVAFSSDSLYVASGSSDATLRVWDVPTGECIRTFESPVSFPSAIAFSPGLQRAVCGLDSGTLEVWDVATGSLIQRVPGDNDDDSRDPEVITFSPDTRWLAVMTGKNVTIRHADTYALISTIRRSSDLGLLAIAISQCSKYLLSINESGVLQYWDLRTADCIRSIVCARGDGLEAACFSADSTRLELIGDRGAVALYDIETETHQTIPFRSHGYNLLSPCLSADSRYLASHSFLEAFVLDTRMLPPKGKADHQLSSHQIVRTFSPDTARFVATTDDDSHVTIRLWETATAPCIAVLGRNTGEYELEFSQDSSRLAIWHDNGRINVVESAGGNQVAAFDLPQGDYYQIGMRFSADLTCLATFRYNAIDTLIKLWDLEKCCEMSKLTIRNGGVDVIFSPNLKWVATEPFGGEIQLWNATNGTKFTIAAKDSGYYASPTFSPCSRFFAWIDGSDHRVHVWCVTSEACIAKLDCGYEYLVDITLSPDSCFLGCLKNTSIDIYRISDQTCCSSMSIPGFEPSRSVLTLSCIDLDTIGIRLETIQGVITAQLQNGTKTNVESEFRGPGLSQDEEWIAYNSRRMMWLPPMYRPGDLVLPTSLVCITYRLGGTLIVEMSL